MVEREDRDDRASQDRETERLAYQKPSLTALGKLSNVTMGSFPGTGESGNPLIWFGN
jgi:hypothetical protein